MIIFGMVFRLLAFLSIFVSEAVHVSATQLCMEIPPSRTDSQELMTELNMLHQHLYSMDASKSKNQNEIQLLNDKIDKVVNDYLISNSCLRYYFKEYISFEEVENSLLLNNGIVVSLRLKLDDYHIDQRKQKLNLNIIDPMANTLRRINSIEETELRFLFDYPIEEKTRDYFNEQYFDVCLENIKYDKSWSSTISIINGELELIFGMNSINKKYAESTEKVNSIFEQLQLIDSELDLVYKQLVHNLRTSEPLLRDKNEDTLTKSLIWFIVIFVIYLIVNFIQISWLIKYLKNKNLI
ncbi:uncharacterized protein C5L36_0D04350 [Pichia kudriavzevii]|uniref:GOLD domain-containing protein n=1 Tax=Pichia kudriavzevii TaxID=4909 RepID=A0A2U9R8K0_PICKU|nr:uncharacterized protein C5L36_0D04350 [Pichia kudriavzevii]AWU77707.1 hypothetical protein C5L36_0D04350 [Pichia kudriavzevii]